MNNRYGETMSARLLKRRRSALAVLATAIVGTLCLQAFTVIPMNAIMDYGYSSLDLHSVLEMVGVGYDDDGVTNDEDGDERSSLEEMEDEIRTFHVDSGMEGGIMMEGGDVTEEEGGEAFVRRQMLTRSPTKDDETEEDYDAAFEMAIQGLHDGASAHSSSSSSISTSVLQPYTLEDALAESKIFEYTFCIVIYDPADDNFLALYSKDHRWKNGNRKLWTSMRYLVYMLRRTFPERFTPSSPEFVFALGGGDYPHVRTGKLPYGDGVAPVLMFGSTFREVDVYRNMIAMPMPEARHLDCFLEWVENGGRRVCQSLRASSKNGKEKGLVFGKEYGLEWDDLTPQLIWRGTDFGFLPTLQRRPSLVHPDARNYVQAPNNLRGNDIARRRGAIEALNAKYDTLLPRWKGAALTAEAELDAQPGGKLPWADIKFTSYLEKGKSATAGSARYALWESVGVGVASGISLADHARYKYHIDLGGGGGTTWSGTMEKLAMPGLLFHHFSPTKDYFHDRLVPWRHYVPVSTDLKDLKRKFDWAEGHPHEAKSIADAGTEFMRRLGTLEGFGEMFREDFVEPLRRVIEAYRPAREVHPDMTSWRDVLASLQEDARVLPVMECTGLSAERSCKLVDGDEVRQFQSSGRYMETSR